MEIPARMKKLPVDARGYVVPWFVAWIDGVPDFRVIEPDRVPLALKFRKCWLCGEEIGRNVTFVLGPMCTVTRTSAEPGCHRECAIYAAVTCPFMITPKRKRRENDLPEGHVEPSGCMIRRNPGVTAVWSTREFKLFRDPRTGGVLVRVGDPDEVLWFCEGRAATRAEVDESIESGIPALRAEEEGPSAVAALGLMMDKARQYLPSLVAAPSSLVAP